MKNRLIFLSDISDQEKLDKLKMNFIYLTLAIGALTVHLTYQVLFYVYGKSFIMKYNIFSIAFYILILLLRDKVSFKMFVILTNIEVSIFTTLAIKTVGWGYGFELLYLVLISLSVFFSINKVFLKYVFLFFLGGVFVHLYLQKNLVGNFQGDIKVFYIFNFGVYFLLVNYINTMIVYYLDTTNKLKNMKLIEEKDKYRRLSEYDSLTSLLNRMAMEAILRDACIDYNSGLLNNISVSFSDIDDFKKINDTYGHNMGDTVLKRVSSIMKENLRDDVIISRWGGEEFLIMLRDIENKSEKIILERIRKKIEEEVFECDGVKFKVTMTFGVCCAYDTKVSPKFIVEQSDSLLYEGKNSGKNTVKIKYI